jgi:hypothetical protein
MCLFRDKHSTFICLSSIIHLHVSQNEQFDIRKSMSPRHSPKDTGNKIDISKPTVVLISAAGQQSSGGVAPAVVHWEQQPVMGILINFSFTGCETTMQEVTV